LFARVAANARGRIAAKLVPIGSLHITIAPKGVGVLNLVLNARGRMMLRTRHVLSCRLRVTVEDQEGGVWQIARSLTIIGAARSARR
jgi:hypothetical protein